MLQDPPSPSPRPTPIRPPPGSAGTRPPAFFSSPPSEQMVWQQIRRVHCCLCSLTSPRNWSGGVIFPDTPTVPGPPTPSLLWSPQSQTLLSCHLELPHPPSWSGWSGEGRSLSTPLPSPGGPGGGQHCLGDSAEFNQRPCGVDGVQEGLQGGLGAGFGVESAGSRRHLSLWLSVRGQSLTGSLDPAQEGLSSPSECFLAGGQQRAVRVTSHASLVSFPWFPAEAWLWRSQGSGRWWQGQWACWT